MKILIFEDEYQDDVNVLLKMKLKYNFTNLKIRDPARVELFESILKYNSFDAIILDIMSHELDLKSINNGEIVPRNMIGIELLKRIRAGHYNTQDKNVPIIMRTARATEPNIYNLCIKCGANYCLPPSEDDELIRILRDKILN